MGDCFYKRKGKRMFDLALAAPALSLLLPLIALLSLLVRIKLGSPVFFRQLRPGLRGAPFEIFKFRTMTEEVDADGHLLPDARRLTGFGKFLRASSLDELPELFNVLKGEMSFIGPRPLLMQYLPRYTSEQARRHEVRPGITGWAQVNGRNAISWEEKFTYDVWYVDNVTLMLDVRILIMTAAKVIRREGVSSPGHATAREFTGARVTEE